MVDNLRTPSCYVCCLRQRAKLAAAASSTLKKCPSTTHTKPPFISKIGDATSFLFSSSISLYILLPLQILISILGKSKGKKFEFTSLSLHSLLSLLHCFLKEIIGVLFPIWDANTRANIGFHTYLALYCCVELKEKWCVYLLYTRIVGLGKL